MQLDDFRRRLFEATPALRQAIAETSKTYVQLAAAAQLQPYQICHVRKGAPFSRRLRHKVIALGALLGVAPDDCVRWRIRTSGGPRPR